MTNSEGKTTVTLTTRYGDAANFCRLFSLKDASEYLSHPERCVTGKAPTLDETTCSYGHQVTRAWVQKQLFALSEMCGTKGRMTQEQAHFCAGQLIAGFGYLKVTDVLLYFSSLIAGRYGYFYGQVDPQHVMAWMDLYLKDRAAIFNRHEMRLKAQQQQQEDARHSAKCVSYEEYQKMKRGLQKSDST